MKNYASLCLDFIKIPMILLNYLKFSQFFKFQEYYSVYIETDHYILKTANHWFEVLKLLLLRYRSFMAINSWIGLLGIDLDEFDFTCDHLVIIHKNTGQVVGTYRLRASTYTDHFYSESEFDLGKLLDLNGVKLELGRACISEKYRNGTVIDLLWKGIAQYANRAGARYLFGCSSVKTLCPSVAKAYVDYLQKKRLLLDCLDVKPLQHYSKKIPNSYCADIQIKLPPLLRTYLAGGAKVYGMPAFDQVFKCIDFMTIMDLEEINPSFKRRYFGGVA